MSLEPNIYWLISFAVGAALWLLARRGRRINDHPMCRRCDFDLTGLPETSDRCPECGGDLRRRRATYVGERHSRPFVRLLAILAFIAPFAGSGYFVYSVLTDANPAGRKPAWWLRLDTTYGEQNTIADAATEMTQRMLARRLSRSEIDGYVQTVLKVQANRSGPWHFTLGDFMEQGYAAQLIADDDFSLYEAQSIAPSPTFELRARVSRDSPLPGKLVYQVDRAGRFASMSYSINREILVDGRRVSTFAQTGDEDLLIDLKQLKSLRPGRHQVLLIASIAETRFTRYPPGVEAFRVTREFELLGPGENSVRMLADASAADSIRRSLQYSEVVVSSDNSIWFGLTVHERSTPLGFRISLNTTDGEIELGQLRARAGEKQKFHFPLTSKPPAIKDARVQLILSASTYPAEMTLDITQIWDGRIVIDDVKVTRRP